MLIEFIGTHALDLPRRSADVHLISTVAALATLALSYRSPAALEQFVPPQRWTQISMLAPWVATASLAAACISSKVLGKGSSTPLYNLFQIPVSERVSEALGYGCIASIVCQVAAIAFAGASFTPYVQNKHQARFIATVLTACTNTLLAAHYISNERN